MKAFKQLWVALVGILGFILFRVFSSKQIRQEAEKTLEKTKNEAKELDKDLDSIKAQIAEVEAEVIEDLPQDQDPIDYWSKVVGEKDDK